MTDLPPPPPSFGGQVFGEQAGYFELSGWWRRVGAVLLDGLIVGVPTQILVAVGTASDSAGFLAFAYLVAIVGGALYSILLVGRSGQTVGKMVLGIRIVRDGSNAPIGYGLATGRYFATILSALPCYLGFLWPLWDDKNQTFHDKICSTVVVKT